MKSESDDSMPGENATNSKGKAPKIWALTEKETVTSFEAWRSNMTYSILLNPDFAPDEGITGGEAEGEVTVSRVDVGSTPILPVMAETTLIILPIDSGSNASCIRQDAAIAIGAEILPTKQRVKQAHNIF